MLAPTKIHRRLGSILLVSLIAVAESPAFGAAVSTAAPSASKVNAAAPVAPLSLSLDEALTRGAGQSPQIQREQENVAAATARKDQKFSAFAPTLDATAHAGTRKDAQLLPGEVPEPGLAPETRDYNEYAAGLVLRQSLFKGMRDYYAWNAAKASQVVSGASLLSSQLDARQAIFEAYFGIQLDVTRIAAEDEAQAARGEQLANVNNKLRAGSATEFDALQAQYEFDAHKPQIQSLKSELGKKKLKFAHLVGLSLDQEFNLSTPLAQAFQASDKAQVLAVADGVRAALERNAELQKLRATRAKLEYDAGEHRGKHLPSVDLVFKGDILAHQRAAIGTPQARALAGQIEISVPLFSGLGSLHERADDAHQIAALDLDFERAKQTMVEDLLAAYRDFELAKEQAASQSSNVALAARAAERARALYQAGRATLKDVLDSYAQQLDAKKSLAETMYQRLTSLARIQKLVAEIPSPSAALQSPAPVQAAPTGAAP